MHKQQIRSELEEKHKLGHLIREDGKAAKMTAASLERGDGDVRYTNRGAHYLKRSTVCKKDESYLDHLIGGVLWFLFLLECIFYLWDLLP